MNMSKIVDERVYLLASPGQLKSLTIGAPN